MDTSLIKEAGMTTEQSVSVGMMISLGVPCGALIYGLLASRWTARGVLILFTVLSSAAIITFILSSSCFMDCNGIRYLGWCTHEWLYQRSLYLKTHLLMMPIFVATGVGWSIGIGRIGAILAPTIAGQLLRYGTIRQSIWAWALWC